MIVFKYPPDRKKEFLKRVIALGGETVEIKEGHVYINGKFCTDSRINPRFLEQLKKDSGRDK